MLIALAGLPGTGKTTLARALARTLPALHLRIDSIEVSLHRAGIVPIDDKGYRIAYAIAEDNLRLGLTVIADSVNPLEVTRKAWVEVAKRAGVFAVEIEIVCSDPEEHRRRIESRTSDIEGLAGPTWQQVVEREYVPCDRMCARIDTAGCTIAESSAALQGLLASRTT
jgi:predicted kinase